MLPQQPIVSISRSFCSLFPLASSQSHISVPDSKDIGFAGRTILALRLRVVLATGLLCRVARLPHQKTPSRRPRKFTINGDHPSYSVGAFRVATLGAQQPCPAFAEGLLRLPPAWRPKRKRPDARPAPIKVWVTPRGRDRESAKKSGVKPPCASAPSFVVVT